MSIKGVPFNTSIPLMVNLLPSLLMSRTMDKPMGWAVLEPVWKKDLFYDHLKMALPLNYTPLIHGNDREE